MPWEPAGWLRLAAIRLLSSTCRFSSIRPPGWTPWRRQESLKPSSLRVSQVCFSFFTNVPLPCLRSTRPWLHSPPTALRTVMMLTPNCFASSASVGRRSPGARSPVMICRFSSSIIWT